MTLDALTLARDLIRCPSVTPAEAGALGVLERTLAAAGFAVERVTFSAPGTPDVENLFATFGSGSPHLALAGHSDVVPPGDAARWTHDPFGAAVAEGRLFGRGAVDMKGGLAGMIAAALEVIAARGGKLPGALSVLVTGDEEGPSINGMPKLLAHVRDRGVRFDHCLLGEPTSVETLGDTIKIGRRGSLSGILTLHGAQGHVAYPHRAQNPMRHLNRILGVLMDVPLDRESAHFERSNCEVVSIDTGNPTFNIIPAQVTARFNVRFNDHWTIATLKEHLAARIEAGAEDTRFSIEWVEGAAESFLTQPGPFVDLVAQAVASVTGTAPQTSTGGGTSDARYIKDHCPVVELGLVGTTMHQVDESTPVADLAGLTRIYRAVIERYFGG